MEKYGVKNISKEIGVSCPHIVYLADLGHGRGKEGDF